MGLLFSESNSKNIIYRRNDSSKFLKMGIRNKPKHPALFTNVMSHCILPPRRLTGNHILMWMRSFGLSNTQQLRTSSRSRSVLCIAGFFPDDHPQPGQTPTFKHSSYYSITCPILRFALYNHCFRHSNCLLLLPLGSQGPP